VSILGENKPEFLHIFLSFQFSTTDILYMMAISGVFYIVQNVWFFPEVSEECSLSIFKWLHRATSTRTKFSFPKDRGNMFLRNFGMNHGVKTPEQDHHILITTFTV
jgi:hypothetical protein